MLKYDNTVSSQVDGKPIYGAQVSVYTADSGTPSLATIFADEAGTTPLSQPILTDQLGYFAFYIGDGKYNIRVMPGAGEISRTNITMVDTLQLKQRALIVPVNEDGGTLPPADQRQNKLLGFDSGGNPTMAVPNSFAGPPGPANSTYTTLAGLKAAAVSNASYIFAPPSGSDGGLAAGTFLYQTAGAPYTADGVNIIKLDAVPLTTGALVRQAAAGVNFDGRSVNAKLLENASVTDARFAGGAKMDGRFSNVAYTTAGSAIVSCADAAFTASDVGKLVFLSKAGTSGAMLVTSIASVQSATQATLATNAGTTVTSASPQNFYWGTDDAAAWNAAIAAARLVSVPPGRSLLGSVVTGRDGIVVRGAGSSAWEPYTGGAFPDVYRSEVVFSGGTAISVAGCNTPRIEGLGIKAAGGRQSPYGAAAGYQAGTVGLDITSSFNFSHGDITFHGCEHGIYSAPTPSMSAQMPHIGVIGGSDCHKLVSLGDSTSPVTPDDTHPYVVRDMRYEGVLIALHCDYYLYARSCDGIRVENVRFFPCGTTAIDIANMPFVTLTGVTLFETGQEQIRLSNIQHVNFSGILARAGAYTTAFPLPQKTALVMDGCLDSNLHLTISQPSGKLIEATGCSATTITLSADTPFFTTGNATNASGAIQLTSCDETVATGTVSGNGHWINVFADEQSARTLVNNVKGEPISGTVRGYNTAHRDILTVTLPTDITLGAGGVSDPVAKPRVYIPAGKVLKARSVKQTSPTVQLRTVVAGNAVLWTGASEADGGTLSIEDKVLFDNSSGVAGYYAVELTLRNPSGGAVTVPAGHQIFISTATV